MSNIATFRGGPRPGEADPDLVEKLEQLLAEAKSGELVAVAHVMLYRDGTSRNGWIGSGVTAQPLGFAISLLAHRYYASVDEHAVRTE